jgi:hypothetical protein
MGPKVLPKVSTSCVDSNLFCRYIVVKCEPGSSVSIVSAYGLDDRAIEVRSPAKAKDFFL